MPELCPPVENVTEETRVPNLGPGTWRATAHLKQHLAGGGAVLRYEGTHGVFVLEGRDGAELARATKTSELAGLLDGLAGKVPRKARVILSIGKLMPEVARVRFAGESLGQMVKVAVEREVARRRAELEADCAALDALDLDGPDPEDGDDNRIARDGLGLMPTGVQ